MKNWSIFSDNVRYVQHNQMTPQNLDIDTLDYRNHKDLYLQLKEEKSEALDIDFGLYPDVTKARYLDVYEDIYAEMVYVSKFDENSDLSTTYLGQANMTRNTRIKAEERFPITGQGVASGKLLDGTECQILLDTGATKSYMSKLYYLKCKTLHALPKFFIKYSKNTSGKWTICKCTICDPSDYRYTRTSILNFYFGIQKCMIMWIWSWE